jgi:hypothetical protein
MIEVDGKSAVEILSMLAFSACVYLQPFMPAILSPFVDRDLIIMF